MDDVQAKMLGNIVLRWLDVYPYPKNSEPNMPPRFYTTWGSKTDIGIGHSIMRIVKDFEEDYLSD